MFLLGHRTHHAELEILVDWKTMLDKTVKQFIFRIIKVLGGVG